MQTNSSRAGLTILAAAVAALSLGAGIEIGRGLSAERPAGLVWAQAPTAASSRGMEESKVIRIARQVSPAVVGISRGEGMGSGILIRGDGIILTNAHVVGQQSQVSVKLATGKEVPGRVLGRDTDVDIAVVKIAGANLPRAALADSDRLEVGQIAIAIGNPLGLERTVTMGVVSARDRKLEPTDAEGFIQTDAAINPGNSGGQLLDSQGRVVVINTIVIRPEFATGLGFAVPINVANDVVRQVLTSGDVRRAQLGIVPGTLTPEIAARFNLPIRQGAVVLDVGPNSPAERAGIREADIITRIGSQPIVTSGDVRRALRARKPGETVTVTLRRGPRTLTLRVKLAEANTQ